MPVLCGVLAGSFAANIIDVSGIALSANSRTSFAEDNKLIENYGAACKNINAEIWTNLSNQEKINALQSICDYECIQVLGYESAKVTAGILDNENVLGQYNIVLDFIVISADHLENDYVEEVLDTLLHKIRHLYQNFVAGMYGQIEAELDVNEKDLPFFRYAAKIRDNMDEYYNEDYFEKN